MGQLAIVIVPPAKDMTLVEGVRRRFDHLADAIPAHVTLVFSFERESADSALLNHVIHAATGFPTFDLVLDGVACSWDHFLFLLVAQGGEQLQELHDRLYTGFLRPLLSEQVFTPHVTLGRFASADECTSAMQVIEPMNLQVRTKAESLMIYDSTQTPYRVTSEVRL